MTHANPINPFKNPFNALSPLSLYINASILFACLSVMKPQAIDLHDRKTNGAFIPALDEHGMHVKTANVTPRDIESWIFSSEIAKNGEKKLRKDDFRAKVEQL